MIRTLIVDDSILFRNQINLALKECPEILVVGSASHGLNALEFLKNQSIDLCILDVEMPVMDGISTLKEMRAQGISVKTIMFSSPSKLGAKKTLEAMNLGALDFITKPDAEGAMSPSEKIRQALYPKILSLFDKKSINLDSGKWQPRKIDSFDADVLLIASSTGGPAALNEFFKELEGQHIPVPILIVQHMPPVFTASLAEQLGKVSHKISKEAADGDVCSPGSIYVAPGDFHMTAKSSAAGLVLELNKDAQRNFVRPAADHLFESVSKISHCKALVVVLTGMGRDGADGAVALKKRGAVIFTQTAATCVVYGMPGAVAADKCHDDEGSPSELARKCVRLLSRSNRHVA